MNHEELSKIQGDIAAILGNLSKQADWQPIALVSISAALGALEKLTQQGDITQAAVENILEAVKNMPGERQTQTLAFFNSVAASSTFNAIVVALKAFGLSPGG